jgi:hypothetical protein
MLPVLISSTYAVGFPDSVDEYDEYDEYDGYDERP